MPQMRLINYVLRPAKPEWYEIMLIWRLTSNLRESRENQITVIDAGIGMSRDEDYSAFRHDRQIRYTNLYEILTGDQAKDSHLIGQFGVGFYSSFIVADKVTVKSRRAGLPKDEGVCWESTGEGDQLLENIR